LPVVWPASASPRAPTATTATRPFPSTTDYADLRTEALLGLCVPERYGGLGADYETYCLVAEQLAQGNASTALTFNMHCLTMLMMGPIADNMAMPPAVRERHEKLRAAKFREVVEEGAFYGQPHSEPVEQGETDTKLGVGGRRFGTTARKVDGGSSDSVADRGDHA
jgi:alkylation response protein AidB-like acyl-CoA dehydrogenase